MFLFVCLFVGLLLFFRVLGLNRLMGFQAYTLFIFGSPLAMIDDIVDQHYLNFLFLIKKNKKKTPKKQPKTTTNQQTNKQNFC
jgi:hypothetical protein